MAGRQNGDSLEGHEDNAPILLTAEQVRTVLPSNNSLPKGWHNGGRGDDVEVGEKAASSCAIDTGTSCAGLTAHALRMVEGPQTVVEMQEGQDGQDVFIDVYAFDTAENAAVAIKGIVAKAHRVPAGYETPKPLKISAGAEETDAVFGERADEYSTEVMMRIGGVVVHLKGYNLKNTNVMQPLAKLQIDRIVKTAKGKNPDAG
ncbi:hypothetical protein [Streptomyces sp. NPDC002994]|uniref:hypothetical protein n=1 Tax=Streptomyces sp. NPDC002994 TaxID=3154441 RepID=UPI0033A258DA